MRPASRQDVTGGLIPAYKARQLPLGIVLCAVKMHNLGIVQCAVKMHGSTVIPKKRSSARAVITGYELPAIILRGCPCSDCRGDKSAALIGKKYG
eukprot:1186631-Prorocentrum_minimum.AAC.2